MGASRAQLGVVLPVLDEADTVLQTARRVREALIASGVAFQLVFVADGSTDETPTLLSAFAKEDPRVSVLWQPEAQGYGAAVRRGLLQLDADVVGWTDGDDQVPPEAILEIYARMAAEGATFGAAIREAREDGPLRGVASRAYNALMRGAIGLDMPDVNAKPKLMSRELFQALTIASDDWFIDTEIAAQVARRGERIVRVPLRFHRRAGGTSKVELSTVTQYVRNLRRLRRERRGLR